MSTLCRYGRKTTLLIGIFPLIAGWILIPFSTTVFTLYLARFLAGISFGCTITALPIYLGEIATDKIRGFLTVLLAVMYKGGILCSYAIGPYVAFKTLAWIAIIPPILFLITFIWAPESPYYLIGKNKRKDAETCLLQLRGEHLDLATEIRQIEEAIQKSSYTGSMWAELLRQPNLRVIIVVVITSAMQQFSGAYVIMSYSEKVFEQVDCGLGSNEIAIILGAVQFGATIIGAVLIDVLGRRPLLFFASVGTGSCSALVGLYFTLEHLHWLNSFNGWIPLIALVIFMACFNIGMATVPYAMIGEMFPKNIKAALAAIVTANVSLIAVFMVKIFQVITEHVGNDIPFWIFASFSFLFIPFVWFIVPETKGKSFDVILEEMNDTIKVDIATEVVE